jgi:hypothetical protein
MVTTPKTAMIEASNRRLAISCIRKDSPKPREQLMTRASPSRIGKLPFANSFHEYVYDPAHKVARLSRGIEKEFKGTPYLRQSSANLCPSRISW